MPISVSLISGPDNPDPRTVIFPDQGGIIGRSPGCELVLPDSKKHVSMRHAFIERIGSRLYLTDLSTNGSFRPGVAAAVGRGNTVEIDAGSRIQCGGYTLELNLSDASAAPAPAETSTQSPPTALADGDPLLQGLLEGLDLDPEHLDFNDPQAFGRRIGEALRHGLATVAVALRMRAHVKGSVHADITQLLPSHINPLKMSLNEIDALEALLGPSHGHFLDAQGTMSEVQRELREHEIAMLAAVRSSMHQVLEELAPGGLEQAAKRPPYASPWRSSSHRAWAAFKDAHAALNDDAKLDAVFGKAYSVALKNKDAPA